ncbi:MAG: TRAP transporter large permease [Lachnospiraceae bacterium]|nr:TRAP transporter large permease [Lachnospiraceae bacterium]
MDRVIIGVIAIAIMLVLLFMGMTIGTAMIFVAAAGMLIFLPSTAAFNKLGTTPFDTFTSYTYCVIPLFLLMANIVASTGLGADLFDFFHKTVGRFRGGLAMASVLACALFAAISSSTVATALTIGMIALPQMKRLKYGPELRTGAVAAGGTLGIMIPPSGTLIIYGLMASVSISKLFVGVIIPGLILAGFMCLSVFIWCRKKPDAGPAGEKYSGKECLKAFGKCVDFFVLIIIVLGGLFAGFFTPTEASGVGVIGALIITAIRKKLTKKNFTEAIVGTVRNSGGVFLILLGAQILNYFIAMSGVPTALANLVLQANMSKIMVVALMAVIYFVLGCFLDSMAMILLTLPVFNPIIVAVGIDPLWFGVIVTICVGIACVSPPVGINSYVTKGISDGVPLSKVFRGVLPFIAAQVSALILLLIFPQLATWLPSLIGG